MLLMTMCLRTSERRRGIEIYSQRLKRIPDIAYIAFYFGNESNERKDILAVASLK